VIVFINEDEAYLHWIGLNLSGFVVNVRRRPTPDYLKMHRARCGYISSDKRENWTTNQYIKVCSLDETELKEWARQEIGGELEYGCYCNSVQKISKVRPLFSSLESIPPTRKTTWTLWRPTEELISLPLYKPLKASWEASTHRDQLALVEYRQAIREGLATRLVGDRLYLRLEVGFSDSIRMVSGNDLENYLTPLFECGCLPANVFRLVIAEKRLADVSRISIGVAEEYEIADDSMPYAHMTVAPISRPSQDKIWKQELEEGLKRACETPLLDGEVDVQIALRRSLSQGRSWHCLWKSVGDAMGPVVGAYERHNRFDPLDDRITSLTLHLCPDESMGSGTMVGYWWRMKVCDQPTGQEQIA